MCEYSGGIGAQTCPWPSPGQTQVKPRPNVSQSYAGPRNKEVWGDESHKSFSSDFFASFTSHRWAPVLDDTVFDDRLWHICLLLLIKILQSICNCLSHCVCSILLPHIINISCVTVLAHVPKWMWNNTQIISKKKQARYTPPPPFSPISASSVEGAGCFNAS